MNVLLVNYEYPPLGGGAGNATMFIARSLLELGHHAVVLTSRFGAQPAFASESDVAVCRVNALRRAPDRSNALQMASFTIAALLAARAVAKRYCIDAVIAFFTIPSGPVGWWLRRTMGVPYVISLRGGDVPGHVPELQRIHRIVAPIRRMVLAGADAVVANSASLAWRSETADSAPVTIIPNGVDCVFFRPRTRTAEVDCENFRVLFVGRVHAEKNVDLLFRAVASLSTPGRSRIRLDIVGDGPDRPRLESLAKELQVDSEVTWHGWRSKEEVAAFYRDADCLVNPSAYEGMPNTVLEAMASALPVVASDVGGNNELVRPGETGLLFPLPDVIALRDCITTLLNDPQLCIKMGTRGRDVAVKEYSWLGVAKRYAALLEGPLADAPQEPGSAEPSRVQSVARG